MAMPVVKRPLYPDVPFTEGTPKVFRSPLTPINVVQLLQADVLTVVRMFAGPQWGIFTQGGDPLVIPDTVTSFDFRKEARISDYVVESGGFQTYDKVLLPFDARVEMTCDGTAMDKSLFLANLATAQSSLDLFNILTPEYVFTNANVVHVDFRRTRQRGASIIHASIWLTQVITSATPQFTNSQSTTSTANAQDPSAIPNVSKGTVQPTTPPMGLVAPTAPPLSIG